MKLYHEAPREIIWAVQDKSHLQWQILWFYFSRNGSHRLIEHMIESVTKRWHDINHVSYMQMLNWMVGPTPIALKFVDISVTGMKFILNGPDYLSIGTTMEFKKCVIWFLWYSYDKGSRNKMWFWSYQSHLSIFNYTYLNSLGPLIMQLFFFTCLIVFAWFVHFQVGHRGQVGWIYVYLLLML